MWIRHKFLALPAFQVRTCHLSSNRAGTNQCELGYQIVELLRIVPWEGGHLRSAFNLEHAYGVRFLNHSVNIRAVLWQVSEVNLFFVMIADQFNGIFEDGHHAQAE